LVHNVSQTAGDLGGEPIKIPPIYSILGHWRIFSFQ
jgi:hypothetical protein